ncbi:MAG: lipase maturation factor family protein [Ignavibacteria bacterium]|nr:MAG: lipase maturation factor family protein [Ignavibacteria bacterium]
MRSHFSGWPARFRALQAALPRILRGNEPEPPTYDTVRWIFLRVIGLIYLVAFLSLGAQILGLIGEDGILPAQQFFRAVRESYGAGAAWRFPSLGLLGAGDTVLQALCWGGAAAALLLTVGVAQAPMLALSWLLYLSLVVAGQEFLSFQWDILLLETGFLAIFFAPGQLLPRLSAPGAPSGTMIHLFRLLLFRLMFFSGYVKLASGDESWRSLTTLTFHYETQPLPTPVAWYAHQLPLWFQEISCTIMFIIELGVPFLFFAPRRLRLIACGTVSVFMTVIMLTGNYTFFNFLTLALCLTLLDDAALKSLVPGRVREKIRTNTPARRSPIRLGLAVLIVYLNLVQFYHLFLGRASLPDPVGSIEGWLAPFDLVNRYGLFAVMTRPRLEIIIEGSDDGSTWKEYGFRYKPGDLRRPPPWVEPHQPRLDWQMWFAALGTYAENRWFVNLCVRLLQGSPEVSGLLDDNPFGGRRPKYVRAELYVYHFTDAATRQKTGNWWSRELEGHYLPPISLRTE